MSTQAERIKQLEHSVYGNGRRGLKERVIIIETRLDTGIKLLWGILLLMVPTTVSVAAVVIDKFF